MQRVDNCNEMQTVMQRVDNYNRLQAVTKWVDNYNKVWQIYSINLNTKLMNCRKITSPNCNIIFSKFGL